MAHRDAGYKGGGDHLSNVNMPGFRPLGFAAAQPNLPFLFSHNGGGWHEFSQR